MRDGKPDIGGMVRYVFGDGSVLPMLVTNVHEDGAIAGQVFLSPAAHEGRPAATAGGRALAQGPVAVRARVPDADDGGGDRGDVGGGDGLEEERDRADGEDGGGGEAADGEPGPGQPDGGSGRLAVRSAPMGGGELQGARCQSVRLTDGENGWQAGVGERALEFGGGAVECD